MLDHLFGLVMLGLGLQSPMTPPVVKGDSTEQSQSGSSGSDHSDETENESENETSDDSGTSGASGASGQTDSHVSPTPFMIDGIPSNVSGERREMYKKEMERRKKELETKRKTMEEQYKAKRELLRADLKETKGISRTKNSTPPGELFRKHTEEEREAFIETVKAKMEQAKTEHESRMTTFKEKMGSFKDHAKKTKVEDIQSRITAFVTKRIGTLTAHITKMSDLVNLNKTQVTERSSGKDTTAFDTAAAAAITAINIAKDKVAELSAKQYVVSVTSESTVKTDVETVRKTIETDMKAAQELMKNARIAVSTMITERAKLLGEEVPDAVIK